MESVMGDQYVMAKVDEALKATSGDVKDAQKLLLTWAVRDQALLLGLAKPELKELAAAAVEKGARALKKSKSAAGLNKESLDTLLRAHAKGEKRAAVKVPPPKSSTRQATVMQQLVDAFKKKR